jgi:hypothetical protein
MGSDSQSRVSNWLATVLGLYVFTVSIAAAYYNWQFARDHGFVSWILLGEIVPTLKATVWPYFAFHQEDRAQAPQETRTNRPEVVGLTRSQVVRAETKKLLLAMGVSQQASYLLIDDVHLNLAEHPKLKEIIELRQRALEAADSVDVEILNSMYPDLGSHFRDDFTGGIKKFLEGCRTYSRAAFVESKTLNDRWADWYNANRAQIEVAVNADK